MARRRNHYQQLDEMMTKVLIADGVIFLLYLIFAAAGVAFLKWLTAIAAIVISAGALVFLYLNQEYRRRRSLWMLVCAGAVLICLAVSMILGYPSPA